MSEFRLAFPACLIDGKHRLAAEDLFILRSVIFSSGVRTVDEANTLLALHASCPEKCEEWDAFFIEALTDFIVGYSYPQGSLDEINMGWLVQTLSTDGVVNSPLELALILRIIETSSNVPPVLSALALDQVRLALTDNTGPYAVTRQDDHSGMSNGDIDYIKRVLQAAMAQGCAVLSSLEITALKRIDRAAAAAFSHPDWRELAHAIGIRDEESPMGNHWLRIPGSMPLAEGAVR